MPGTYLFLLLIAIICVGFIDKRYNLAVFRNWRWAVKVILLCVVFFIVWDILGILLDIFYIGKTSVLLGVNIGDFPVEEVFFLTLLNYTALVASQFLKHRRNPE